MSGNSLVAHGHVSLFGGEQHVQKLGTTGVTELDDDELSELTPYGVSSLTVNVYAVPLVKPEMVIELHGELHVFVIEPGVEVALYVPLFAFPLYVDSVKGIVA